MLYIFYHMQKCKTLVFPGFLWVRRGVMPQLTKTPWISTPLYTLLEHSSYWTGRFSQLDMEPQAGRSSRHVLGTDIWGPQLLIQSGFHEDLLVIKDLVSWVLIFILGAQDDDGPKEVGVEGGPRLITRESWRGCEQLFFFQVLFRWFNYRMKYFLALWNTMFEIFFHCNAVYYNF